MSRVDFSGPDPSLCSMSVSLGVCDRGITYGALDGGAPMSRMSIIRNGNVALSNLRKPYVARSILRKCYVALSLRPKKGHVAVSILGVKGPTYGYDR